MNKDELFNALTIAFPDQKLGLLNDVFDFFKPYLRPGVMRAAGRHSWKGEKWACTECGDPHPGTKQRTRPCPGKSNQQSI